MNRKIIAFLIGMAFATHVNAMAYHWGLPGTRDGDIQRITITEVAAPGRTVTLTKPDEVAGFAGQFALFSLYFQPRHWGDDFYKVFSVHYRISVQRSASTDTYLLMSIETGSVNKIDRPDDPIKAGIEFQLWVPEKDGSFTEYSEGARHWLDAGPSPLEQSLAHLFPKA